MGELESITPAKATMAVGKRVAIGAAVGISQVLWEKLDTDRGTPDTNFGAIQNLVPLATVLIGAVATIVPKKQKYKTLGADLVSSGSTMLAYRAMKIGNIQFRKRGGMRSLTRSISGKPSMRGSSASGYSFY